MTRSENILLDFGRGPEPAALRIIGGTPCYISRRQITDDVRRRLRRMSLEDEEYQSALRELRDSVRR